MNMASINYNLTEHLPCESVECSGVGINYQKRENLWLHIDNYKKQKNTLNKR